MTYEYRYINKQVFESSVCFTLLIEDVDTKETYRVEQSFKVEDAVIDDEFLRKVAKIEIQKIINNIPIEEVIEVPPDEALSDG